MRMSLRGGRHGRMAPPDVHYVKRCTAIARLAIWTRLDAAPSERRNVNGCERARRLS